jgi:hypothetical protein
MENTSEAKVPIPGRTRGRALVVLGTILIVGPGILAVYLGPDLLHPGGEGSSFTGTFRQGVFGLATLVLLTLFGLSGLVGGLQLIRKGSITKRMYIIGAALLMMITGLVKNTFPEGQSGSDSGFTTIANQINQDEGLPKMENGMRMERVSASGKMLNFTVTLTNLASADIDPSDAGRFVAAFKKDICGKAILKKTIGRGGSLYYRWLSKDGNQVAELLLMNGTCERD